MNRIKYSIISISMLISILLTSCSNKPIDPMNPNCGTVVPDESSNINTSINTPDISNTSSIESEYDSVESTNANDIDTNLIREQINNLMIAVQSGDLDSITQITQSDFYDELKYPNEFSEIISKFYNNMVWDLEYLSDARIMQEYNYYKTSNDYFDVSMPVGSRRFMYYNEYNLLRYNKDDIIPEDFKFDTKEDAEKAFGETLDTMPLLYQNWEFRISLKDPENSKINIVNSDYNYFTKEDYVLSHAKENEMLIDLLNEVCFDGYIIAPDNVPVEHDDIYGGGIGLRKGTIDLLKQKKFTGAYNLLLSKSDKIDSDCKYEYEELTDNQKEYMQYIIDNCTTVYPIEYSDLYKTSLKVTLIIDCPAFCVVDESVKDWIAKNNLRDVDMAYCTTYTTVDDFYDKCFGYYWTLLSEASQYEGDCSELKIDSDSDSDSEETNSDIENGINLD